MSVFNWFGDKVSKKTRIKAIKANQKAGEALLTEANKTVPHDEGTLERSGSVDTKDDKNTTTYISYDTPYAIRWHEAPKGSVNFSDPKARVKWLEQTAKEMSNKLEKFVAKEMKG